MKFPEKLWNMVNDCISGAIGWGIDGKTIFIDYGKFESEFLGESTGVFKTKNVVSFIRQLNLYGFRKCSRYNDVHEFKNPYFIRGRKDLLKYMRRKLGYTLDIALPFKEEPEDFKMTEESKKDNPDNVGKYFNPQSTAGSSNSKSSPFSQDIKPHDLNSLSCGWWGNSYFPMNNAMYPMRDDQSPKEESDVLKIKEEQEDYSEQKDENSYWKNLNMYNNIIFVPVPAHYGLYPGFFNGNMQIPFGMPLQNQNKNDNAREE